MVKIAARNVNDYEMMMMIIQWTVYSVASLVILSIWIKVNHKRTPNRLIDIEMFFFAPYDSDQVNKLKTLSWTYV